MSPGVVAGSRRNREAESVVPQASYASPRLKIVVPDPLSQPNIISAQPLNEFVDGELPILPIYLSSPTTAFFFSICLITRFRRESLHRLA